MPAPVVIKLQVDGVDQIRAAFKSIEDIVTKSETVVTNTAKHGSQVRKTEAEREAQFKKRTDEKRAQDQVAIWKKTDAMVAQFRQQGLRDHERAEKEKTRILERETREVVNMEIAMYRKRKQEHDRFQHAIGRSTAQGASTGARWAGGMIGAAMQLGGGFSIADAVQTRMAASGMAAGISNTGYLPNGDTKGLTGDALRRMNENKTRQTSASTLDSATAAGQPMGFSQDDTLKGLNKFVGLTGDLRMGKDVLGQMAELARATNTNFEDLAATTAEVFNADTTMDAKALMTVVRDIAGQGKVGAVDMPDLAKNGAKIMASAGNFGGNREDNMRTLGAMAQTAKATGSAANPAQAATSIAAFGNTFNKNARIKGFKNMGADIYGADNKLLGPEQIIINAIKGAAKHGAAKDFDKNMGTMFMDSNARKATKGYEKAYKDAGGGEAGIKAVEAEFDRVRKAAMSEAEAKESAGLRMAEADMQYQKVMLELRDATAKELIPALIQLAPALSKLTPFIGDAANALGRFMSYAAENPLKGIGLVISAGIGKELVASGMKSMLEKAFASSLGNAGLILGSAMIAIQMGKIIIDDVIKNENRVFDDARKDKTEAANLTARLRDGTASDADVKRAAQLADNMNGDRDAIINKFDNESAPESAAMGYLAVVDAMSPLTGTKTDMLGEHDVENAKQREVLLKQNNKAQEELISAMKALTAANLATARGENGTGIRVPTANQSRPMGARPGANE